MTSFRYPVSIVRRHGGHFDGPVWVSGPRQPDKILGTVQPATSGDYDQMQPLLEGRRVDGMIRLYTDAMLGIAGERDNAPGDLVIWPQGLRGGEYEVVARSVWQSRILPHYRYLAALVAPVRA